MIKRFHGPARPPPWVNGLGPGRYYVRAWGCRYVQSALDGATFLWYYFGVTPNDWAGYVTLTLNLRPSSHASTR